MRLMWARRLANCASASVILILLTAAADPERVPKAEACNTTLPDEGKHLIEDCTAALAVATESNTKYMAYYLRGYGYNGTGEPEEAIKDLTLAGQLEPDAFMPLIERAYAYNELGEYKRAQDDLDSAAKMKPDLARIYKERALSRFRLCNLDGALADREQAVALEPNDPDHLVARSIAYMWLGRFDQASSDLDTATLAANKTGNKTIVTDVEYWRRQLGRWTKISSDLKYSDRCIHARDEKEFISDTFIGDCTRAFLETHSRQTKADVLANRAIAIELQEQSRAAPLDDFFLAACLDPDNGDTHANLGGWLNGNDQARLALEELDLAIKLKPSFVAFASRAATKYDLGDDKGAFFDAKKSFEMRPNDVALTVLGDLSYRKTKSYDKAKVYWMGALRLGDRDDGLIARLKAAGMT